MKDIFQEAFKILSAGEKVAMLAIIRHAGSSPRTTGARMLVRTDGSSIGTIGGGLLEAEAIQQGTAALANGAARVSSWNFDGQKAGEMGMICGGRVEVLIQPLSPENDGDQRLYAELSQFAAGIRQACLVTQVVEVGDAGQVTVNQAVTVAGQAPQGLPADVAQALMEFGLDRPGNQPGWVTVSDISYLVEPVTNLATVFLFGAGHVSQMLASLTGWVGFRTVVIDDRAEFANASRFPQADEVVCLDSFDEAFERLAIGKEGYVVIVTRGHADDLRVAVGALRTPAGYIGMIGSRRKRELVYQALIERGFTAGDLARIHSPIGTDIGAETPEEIAISIAGELIQARAGLL
jgi:xanthine dehydrogenase accessory factor